MIKGKTFEDWKKGAAFLNELPNSELQEVKEFQESEYNRLIHQLLEKSKTKFTRELSKSRNKERRINYEIVTLEMTYHREKFKQIPPALNDSIKIGLRDYQVGMLKELRRLYDEIIVEGKSAYHLISGNNYALSAGALAVKVEVEYLYYHWLKELKEAETNNQQAQVFKHEGELQTTIEDFTNDTPNPQKEVETSNEQAQVFKHEPEPQPKKEEKTINASNPQNAENYFLNQILPEHTDSIVDYLLLRHENGSPKSVVLTLYALHSLGYIKNPKDLVVVRLHNSLAELLGKIGSRQSMNNHINNYYSMPVVDSEYQNELNNRCEDVKKHLPKVAKLAK